MAKAKEKVPVSKGKKAGRVLLVIGIAILGFLVALVVYLTINEYNPDSVEELSVPGNASEEMSMGMPLRVATLNTGYGALSTEADFFMDGGKTVNALSETAVRDNLQGMGDLLTGIGANVYFLQEVDQDSKRSFNIDEVSFFKQATGLPGIFANNYKCNFVPYPLPFIGKVDAGLLTLTNLHAVSAQRIALPNPFQWPIRTANLKRCLLVEHVPIAGSDKELVLINLHLEAYDDGEGKKAQMDALAKIMETEYLKGNYVIAGGDFNQTFPEAAEYPVVDRENWQPGILEAEMLPAGFSFVFDDSIPTSRLLSAPYTGSYETSQVYVIDGFIVSNNVMVNSVTTLNDNFHYTDHQPVVLDAALIP